MRSIVGGPCLQDTHDSIPCYNKGRRLRRPPWHGTRGFVRTSSRKKNQLDWISPRTSRQGRPAPTRLLFLPLGQSVQAPAVRQQPRLQSGLCRGVSPHPSPCLWRSARSSQPPPPRHGCGRMCLRLGQRQTHGLRAPLIPVPFQVFDPAAHLLKHRLEIG